MRNKFVCHKCDNRFCVRPDHLFLGTQAENMRDMVNKGRHGLHKNPGLTGTRHGAFNGRSVLQPEQVLEIRAAYPHTGETQKQLATRFGVSPSLIRSILTKKSWLWLDTLAAVKPPPSVEQRFWDKVEKTKACWNWRASKDGNGRGQFMLRPKVLVRAHRFAYSLIYGEIPKTKVVLHTCDNPLCCRPDHLVLGSQQDNARDMANKKRQIFQQHPEVIPRGESCASSKLTEAQVKDIRRRRYAGETLATLAAVFGVSTQNVAAIATRQTWTHI